MEKYTTSRGVEIEFVSIATLLDKFQSGHKAPEPPTYEITSKITGNVERIAIDEQSIIETPDQFTPEQHAAWKTYKEKLDAHTTKYNRDLTRLILLRGILVKDADSNEWAAMQEALGISVPVDPIERRIHYIETEVMGSIADYQNVTLGVMGASGVDSGLLTQVAESFRRPISESQTGQPADTAGKVDGDATLGTSARGA